MLNFAISFVFSTKTNFLSLLTAGVAYTDKGGETSLQLLTFWTDNGSRLRTKHADYTHNVAATDGTFGESLATCCTRHHVSTLKQQAINDGIHAHLADIAVKCCSRTVTWWTCNYRHITYKTKASLVNQATRQHWMQCNIFAVKTNLAHTHIHTAWRMPSDIIPSPLAKWWQR